MAKGRNIFVQKEKCIRVFRIYPTNSKFAEEEDRINLVERSDERFCTKILSFWKHQSWSHDRIKFMSTTLEPWRFTMRSKRETERGFLISAPIRLSSSTNKYQIWSIVALEIFHFTFTSTNYLPNSTNPVLHFNALQEIHKLKNFRRKWNINLKQVELRRKGAIVSNLSN